MERLNAWRILAVGRGKLVCALLSAAAISVAAPSAVAEEDADATAGEDAATETMIVTGTRLNEDPTGRLLVISAEAISALGLSSTEEVIRSLPHNFSTINDFNNLEFGSNVLDTNLGALGLGVSTANLRGLGSRNTLVLVNGRRIAGAAGNSQFFANIRHIPAGAIERVEVLLDGGGSIYGSDAIGGVINIVLKQDFTGAGVAARTEISSTGGDRQRLDGQFGYSWDTGSVSATVSRTEGQPVKYAETGYTSRDYSPLFDGIQSYNFVGGVVRSGVVRTSRWGGNELILPPGNDGRNAQPDDFVAFDPIEDSLDRVPEDAGSANTDTSITLNIRQELFERLALTAEVLQTKAISERAITTFGFSSILVPESNAFNNFGREVFVQYDADEEVRRGLLNPAVQTDVTRQRRYVFGAEYSLGERGSVSLEYQKSLSEGEGVQQMFAPDTGTLDDELKDLRLAELLASDDPSEAVNFFGDGTGQNPTIAEFHVPFASSVEETYTQSWESKMRFNAYKLPGGWLNMAGGFELREEALEDLGDDFEVERGVGVRRPSRDLTALFLEALIPVFGRENARAGLQSLTFKIAARSDRYETMGAVGNLEPASPGADPLPNFTTAKFSNIAPEVGIFYKPISTLELRVKRSEGFRAPTFSQLFSRFTLDRESRIYEPLTGTFVPGRLVYGPNPDLLPETSQTLNIGARWSPEWGGGLLITVDYSEVDIRDRIASSSELSGLLPVEVYANLPEFFERAPDGTLLVSRSTSVNIAQRVSESVDVHISRAFETDFGRFLPEIEYSRVLDQFDVPAAGAPKASFVGESVGVDRYNARAKLTWVRGPTSVTVVGQHKPGYINNDFERSFFRQLPNMPVGSYTTWDASAKHSWDNGLTVRVGGRNILDKKPPFMLSERGLPYDAKRVDLRGRVFWVELKYDLEI